MNKHKLFLVALFLIINRIDGQIITTPNLVPITIQVPTSINGNLSFSGANRVISFNNVPTIKLFGTGNTVLGENSTSLVGVNYTGQYNVFFGLASGQSTSAGNYNVSIGAYSGSANSGSSNMIIGAYAGQNNTGSNNSIIGDYAGLNNKGNHNIFFGPNAGENNLGNENVFIGKYSGKTNTTGAGNIFLGSSSGGANTAGSNNYFSCYAAGYKNTTGNQNVMIGFQSGWNSTTGSSNIFIGKYAGQTNTTENSNIFIGDNADIGVAGVTNSTAIGNNAKAAVSNALILGNTNTTTPIKIGIGTSAPTDKLHVYGSVRFENLPTDAPGGTAVQYVVMDATGKLYKYTGTAPTRQGVVENSTLVNPSSFTENWTLKNDFLYNKNKKGIIIGEGISSLPKGYGMYVTDGILTEKVKVALKNTSDWADYVFDKNYNRLTLLEVDKFINKYKHLPNVPTSIEMANSGNDLHKTDVKLLEKIEELTLYMIELKKESVKVKSDNANLKKANKLIMSELKNIKSKLK